MHRVPENARVYAVGDIHGRADLLGRLHDLIRADAAPFHDRRLAMVYLGDYIDRGPSSREVLDILVTSSLPGFETIHLKGNHEDLALGFLDDAQIGLDWTLMGGDATLMSYGAADGRRLRGSVDFATIQEKFHGKLPTAHLEFLRNLGSFHVEGDYLFVHAGVRPGRPMEDQDEMDLIWIRGDFLQSTEDHGRMVVHGHSITHEPEIRPNRIGIDTGAYATGRLTCLVLDGDGRSFLST
ncbi:MAG: serine/threonine protein phosphatase [Alphaproteobacteria bacterium]|nr:serine/threonine protein phosphatase [Pseudomonadota bacterium]TDI64087.1 MAG: serine/threonine protein phosphatase [Alphaproteobacteria bacterium]